jgi:hypothetical protein
VKDYVRDVGPVIEVQFDCIPCNKFVVHWHVSVVASGGTDMRDTLRISVVNIPRRWDEDSFFVTCPCVLGFKRGTY